MLACGAAQPVAPAAPTERVVDAAPTPVASRADALASDRDDEQVLAGMRQGFRGCYQIGLWNNPHQGGSVRLVLRIDARGSPASVKSVGGAGLDHMVVECLVKVARRASFAPPMGGEGSIEVPIRFASDRQIEAANTPRRK